MPLTSAFKSMTPMVSRVKDQVISRSVYKPVASLIVEAFALNRF